MSNLKTINLPDYGDFDEVEVIEICVESGQEVDSEEPILILETDKAAMEIPSSVNGIVNKVILLSFNNRFLYFINSNSNIYYFVKFHKLRL